MPVRFSLTAQQQTPVHGSAGSGSCLFIEASPEVGQRCAEAGRLEVRGGMPQVSPLHFGLPEAVPSRQTSLEELSRDQPELRRGERHLLSAGPCYCPHSSLCKSVVSSPQITPDLPRSPLSLAPWRRATRAAKRRGSSKSAPAGRRQGGEGEGGGGRVQRSFLDCSPEERHTRGTDRALAGSAKPTVHSPPGRLPEGGICSGEQARLRRHGRKSARCCSCPSQVLGVPLQHAARRSPRRQTGCRRRASDELEGGRGERATRRGRRRATARRVGVEGELEADHLETAPR